MSKSFFTSVLGLALAAFVSSGAQAAVHGVFGDGYSVQSLSAQGADKPYAAKRSGKRYGARQGGKRHASRARSGKRHAHSHGGGKRHAHAHGGGTSRACLQASARALLSRIEAQFGAVQIVSTCRPGAVIAGSGKPSKHRYGLAIDFNAPAGKKGAIVQWLIKNHHSGGTMTYAGMNHIHVDVGSRFVSLGAGGRRRG